MFPEHPPANVKWGSEPWESIRNDPDLANRIHNHPAGLLKGRKHYNANDAGTAHLEKALGRAFPLGNAGLVLGAAPGKDVEVTREHLDKAAKGSGKAPDYSLAGMKVRFSPHRDSFNRGNAISHVFLPPGHPEAGPPRAEKFASRLSEALRFAAPRSDDNNPILGI